MPTRKKIGLIGAGNIGGELARLCANEELGDVLLFDIPAKENFAKGKALDLEQNGAVLGYDSNIRGTANWADLEGRRRPHHHRRHPAQARASRATTSSRRTCRSSATSRTTRRSTARTRSSSSSRTRSTRWSTSTSASSAAPKEHGRRHGGRPRQRALPALPRARGRRQREGRARDGPRRPRRRHGARPVDDARSTASRCRRSSRRTSSTKIVERTRKGGGEIVNLMGTSAYYAPGVERGRDGQGVPARREAPPRRAPRTSTASTATRTSSWASRSSSAARASRRSSRSR